MYGFTGIGSNLQVTTTNGGADNITGAQYDAFEQVLFAPSGITFSINNNGKSNRNHLMIWQQLI